MTVVEEGDKWIDVGTASSATRNDLIWNNRDWVLNIMQGCVRLNDEREGEFGLLEERVSRGHSIQGRSNIFRRAVSIRRWSYACLLRVSIQLTQNLEECDTH